MFQVHKIIGFAPALIQVVMSDLVDMPVRQAGKSIHLLRFKFQYTVKSPYNGPSM